MLAGLLTAALTLIAWQGLPERSERSVSYTIEVDLDAAQRRTRGKEIVTYRNRTGAPTDQARFHLYWNAFRAGSTFMRETDDELRRKWRDDEQGECTITNVVVRGADGLISDVTRTLRFDAPDDGNAQDHTVAVVDLPAPLLPEATMTLEVAFETKIPKAYRRAGWAPGGFFMMVQWFPKLGVLERQTDGSARWNCHQFHANCEFYSEHGTYDVTLRTPVGMVIGATGGIPTRSELLADGRTQELRFEQADVHDFAWVADPDFRRHEKTFAGATEVDHALLDRHARLLGRDPATMQLTDVKVILLLHPEHDTIAQRERHFAAVSHALRFYGSRYGRYPYPVVTAVDPATDGAQASFGGGMEYPMLFTCGAPLIPHDRELDPEGVTVHECGHQFWYGLSANNEFEESWLDEGINTWSESRCQDLAYADRRPTEITRLGELPLQGRRPFGPDLPRDGGDGPQPPRLLRWLPVPVKLGRLHFSGALLHDVPLLRGLRESPYLTYAREARIDNLYGDRAGFLDRPQTDSLVRNGWEYWDRKAYVNNSYYRPSTLLNSMERFVGADRWWTTMRLFHEQSRFRAPTTAEFVALVARQTDRATADLFNAAITGPARLDYGVDPPRSEQGPDGRWRHEVTVRRHGELCVPVRVRFRFAQRATPVEELWPAEGQYAWKRFVFADSADETFGDLVEVRVDPPPERGAFEKGEGPAGVWLLDQNLLDNAWRKQADHGPALARATRSLLATQSILSFVGIFK